MASRLKNSRSRAPRMLIEGVDPDEVVRLQTEVYCSLYVLIFTRIHPRILWWQSDNWLFFSWKPDNWLSLIYCVGLTGDISRHYFHICKTESTWLLLLYILVTNNKSPLISYCCFYNYHVHLCFFPYSCYFAHYSCPSVWCSYCVYLAVVAVEIR